MIRPEFYHFESTEAEAPVRRALEPLLPHFPAWVLGIAVFAKDSGHTEHIGIWLDPRYKRVAINVGPDFYTADEKTQRRDMTHEFFHAITGELVDWVSRAIIRPMKAKDEAMHDVLKREFDDRVERVAQELTHLFLGCFVDGDEQGGES